MFNSKPLRSIPKYFDCPIVLRISHSNSKLVNEDKCKIFNNVHFFQIKFRVADVCAYARMINSWVCTKHLTQIHDHKSATMFSRANNEKVESIFGKHT